MLAQERVFILSAGVEKTPLFSQTLSSGKAGAFLGPAQLLPGTASLTNPGHRSQGSDRVHD